MSSCSAANGPDDSRGYSVKPDRRQFNRQGTCQSFECSADACGNYPSTVWALAGDSSRENDRAAVANLRTSIFDGGKCRPIAQFKCASRLLEIRISKVMQLQVVTCGENQVIKGANVREDLYSRALLWRGAAMPSRHRTGPYLN